MKGAIALRKVVGLPIINDCTVTTITTAAWVQLTATLDASCSGLEIENTSAKSIQIGVGASGSEVAFYAVAPGVNTVLIPHELKKGSRISAKAVTADATTGALIINKFG